MALDNYKITSGEVAQVHVEKQDTVLSGTPLQNKQVFDAYPDLIVDKFNALVEYIGTDLPTTLAVLQRVYKIGSLYTNTTGVDPHTELGFGTWVLLDGITVKLTRHGTQTEKNAYIYERTI